MHTTKDFCQHVLVQNMDVVGTDNILIVITVTTGIGAGAGVFGKVNATPSTNTEIGNGLLLVQKQGIASITTNGTVPVPINHTTPMGVEVMRLVIHFICLMEFFYNGLNVTGLC
jgi:hypothetical protein